MSKFERSQLAHRRLFAKHNNVFGSLSSDIKSDYHFTVSQLQHKSQKLLSRSEKKVIFDHSYERTMGRYPTGSKTTYKKWCDVVRKYSK